MGPRRTPLAASAAHERAARLLSDYPHESLCVCLMVVV